MRSFVAMVFSIFFVTQASFADQHKSAIPVSTPKITTIKLESKLVDGKKTWLPLTVTAPKGVVEFQLVNTFPEPHGFSIDSILKTPVIVPANKTVTVKADFTKAGTYDLKCHLHPAHVKSVITITE